jgi:hypothetical protein
LSVNWKDPLEEIRMFNNQMEQQINIIKRPTYIMNILYTNKGIYLSKRLQLNKEMYNMWQASRGKVEREDVC